MTVFQLRKALVEEKWCSTDWKLDLISRMLQKSIDKVLEEVSRHPRLSAVNVNKLKNQR